MIPALFAPGVFDGFNVAHQSVIRALRARADALHAKAVTIRIAEAYPPAGYLATPAEVQSMVVKAGADCCIPVSGAEDGEAWRKWTAFYDVRGVVCGQECDPSERWGASAVAALKDAPLIRVPTIEQDGQRVTTDRARDLVVRGAVREAAQLLGRPYAVQSTVVRGKGIGRNVLGFPTLNLAPAGFMAPAPGVYAGWAWIEGQRHMAAVNVPEEGHPIEAHVLHYAREQYGARVRVEFLQRIRHGRRFPNHRALAQQIARDVEAVERMLASRQ